MRTPLLVFVFLAAALVASAGPITNGDFESGILGVGGGATGWTDVDSEFGSTWCDPSCGNGGGTAGPHSGTGFIWFGGSDDGQTASLSQAGITLNPGDLLQFYFRIGDIPPETIGTKDTTGVLTLSIDSTQIFSASHVADAATYSQYALVSLTLGTLADGGLHTLTFNYSDLGGGFSDFNVDDVSLASDVPEPTSAVLIGLGLVGVGFFARKRRHGKQ